VVIFNSAMPHISTGGLVLFAAERVSPLYGDTRNANNVSVGVIDIMWRQHRTVLTSSFSDRTRTADV